MRNLVLVLICVVACCTPEACFSETEPTPTSNTPEAAEIKLSASSQPAGVISHAKILVVVRSKIDQAIKGSVTIRPVEPLKVAAAPSALQIGPHGAWSETIELTTDGPVNQGNTRY